MRHRDILKERRRGLVLAPAWVDWEKRRGKVKKEKEKANEKKRMESSSSSFWVH